MSDPTTLHGWTAVPRTLDKLIANRATNTSPLKSINDVKLPDTKLAQDILAYARTHLPSPTFNHSMRVFYYGQAILSHFPTWPLSAETHLLASLLHDLGTTPHNQTSTHLSFDFHGGILALNLLSHPPHSAPQAQAEAVCEAIIRHQDVVGETGTVTVLTAVMQMATLMDNVGRFAGQGLVEEGFVREVEERWGREGWRECFAGVLERELGEKPWTNASRVEGFVEGVLGWSGPEV